MAERRAYLGAKLSGTLKDRLQRAADARGWSLSAEVSLRLEQSFDRAELIEQIERRLRRNNDVKLDFGWLTPEHLTSVFRKAKEDGLLP